MDNTQESGNGARNVPWGLADAFLIAMMFFFAPCLLLTLILNLPQGHRFFLPDTENLPAIIWSAPRARPQDPAASSGEVAQEEELEFNDKTSRTPDNADVTIISHKTNDSEGKAKQILDTIKTNVTPSDSISPNEDEEMSDEEYEFAAMLDDECRIGGLMEDERDDDLETAHPLTQLLVRSKGTARYWWAVFFAFLAGVVAAPLVEEFLFRVVLQGALEKKPSGAVTIRSQRFRVAMAIVIPALFFAAIHYRSPELQRDLDLLFLSIVITPFGLLTTLVFGVLWLKIVRKATRRDLGIVWNHFPTDFCKGFGVFFLLVPILVPVIYQLRFLFPDTVTDPVPIFILALGLGVLYHKTHRYASVVGMHFALNFFSFILLLIR